MRLDVRLLYYILVVIIFVGLGCVIINYVGVLNDPIVGDWECAVNNIVGIGYSFNADGTYRVYFVDVENGTWDNDVFETGTWSKIGEGYYKIYDRNGMIDGYFTLDNGWLYSGKYAFKKIK